MPRESPIADSMLAATLSNKVSICSPVLTGGAAGAHRDPGELRQADPLGRIQQAAGAHQGDAADQGQIVIFQQVELHAVGQREGGGIRRLDGAQRRILEVLGRRHAAGGARQRLRGRVRRRLGRQQRRGLGAAAPGGGGAGFSVFGAPDPEMPPSCAQAAAARRRMPSKALHCGPPVLRSGGLGGGAALDWPGSTVYTVVRPVATK